MRFIMRNRIDDICAVIRLRNGNTQRAIGVRNIIMIHTMMVMMMSIWMETMIMTDTTAMMIMLPV